MCDDSDLHLFRRPSVCTRVTRVTTRAALQSATKVHPFLRLWPWSVETMCLGFKSYRCLSPSIYKFRGCDCDSNIVSRSKGFESLHLLIKLHCCHDLSWAEIDQVLTRLPLASIISVLLLIRWPCETLFMFYIPRSLIWPIKEWVSQRPPDFLYNQEQNTPHEIWTAIQIHTFKITNQ